MRYIKAGGQKAWQDREKLEEQDKREGRMRVPAQVLTAIIGMGGGISLWAQNIEMMKPTLQKMGLWGKARCCLGLMQWIKNAMYLKISTKQIRTIQENTKDMIVSVSTKPNPRTVNLPTATVEELLEVILQEKCGLCLCDRQAAEKCELRKLLDTVPNVVSDESNFWACPYMQGGTQEWKV